MCTSIVEIANATGMAKRNEDWFELTHSVVSYDHARHALLDEAITLDFVNTDLPAGARAAVELSLETAKELREALDRAIAAALGCPKPSASARSASSRSAAFGCSGKQRPRLVV